eukprot:3255138-Karenia_brevis.AAC.1
MTRTLYGVQSARNVLPLGVLPAKAKVMLASAYAKVVAWQAETGRTASRCLQTTDLIGRVRPRGLTSAVTSTSP